jgi:hypothetical protein
MKNNFSCGLVLAIIVLVVGSVLFLNVLNRTWQIIVSIILIIASLVYLIRDKQKQGKGKPDFLQMGKLLFQDYQNEFESYYNLYLREKEEFIRRYRVMLLKNNKDAKLKDISPLEVIYAFADDKGIVHVTDWRGEENEEEIQEFIDRRVSNKSTWTNVNTLRRGVDAEKQRDDKFIIHLLKAIDKDLIELNRKLVFFNLGWDAYVYAVVDPVAFKTILNKFSDHFHGTENL